MKINDLTSKKAIDIDDTLFDFIGPYLLFNNLMHGTRLKKEDFTSYRFNEFRGGTMEEAIESVKDFCYSPFFEQMIPFPSSIDVINKLKKENELFVVTSRPLEMQDITFKQIEKYFPKVFSDILFSSNYYTGARNSGKSKAEICELLGISLLIDDSLNYAKECLEKNINVILLDSPWNRNGQINGIIRAKNWKEIGEILS